MDTTKYDALINWIIDSSIQGGEFLKAQAPDVALQIISYGFWSSLFGLIICVTLALIMATCSTLCVRSFIRSARTSTSNEPTGLDETRMVFAIICGLLSAALFIASTTQIPTLIKTAVAPKVYLLEQLRILK